MSVVLRPCGPADPAYQREYGPTELRVYATGLMVWLGIVFVWALVTVLRGRRELFAMGALVAAFAGASALTPTP
jgi:Domain of unknown function (DUF4173)